jgi:hypothetical protein
VFVYANHAEGNGAFNVECLQSPSEEWSDEESGYDSDAVEVCDAESSMSDADSSTRESGEARSSSYAVDHCLEYDGSQE